MPLNAENEALYGESCSSSRGRGRKKLAGCAQTYTPTHKKCSVSSNTVLSLRHISTSASTVLPAVLNISQQDQHRGLGYTCLPDSLDVHRLRVSQPFPGGRRGRVQGRGVVAVCVAVSQVGSVHVVGVVVRSVSVAIV